MTYILIAIISIILFLIILWLGRGDVPLPPPKFSVFAEEVPEDRHEPTAPAVFDILTREHRT